MFRQGIVLINNIMKFILPSILIALSIVIFFFYIKPTLDDISTYKGQVSQYDDALNNEMKLEQDRDALSNAYHSFPLDAEDRLGKLLPDNADNIRLVIDIQKMAIANGVNVVSTEFDSNQGATGTSASLDPRAAQKDYGIFNLTFSVSGTYQNFLNFLKQLEASLRIVDIQSIDFSSGDKTNSNYTFLLKVDTYWLKAK